MHPKVEVMPNGDVLITHPNGEAIEVSTSTRDNGGVKEARFDVRPIGDSWEVDTNDGDSEYAPVQIFI